MIGLLFLIATPGLSAADSEPAETLIAAAESAYRAGIAARDDAAKARPHFRAAADAYQQLWDSGQQHPWIARDMAQSHLLAGDLARAIRAYHLGLRQAPYDRELQAGLAYARERVAYPSSGTLAESARPRDHFSLLRSAPAELFWGLAAGFYLLAMLAAARAWMTRRPAWRFVGGVSLFVAVALAAATWWQEKMLTEDNRRRLVVVKENGVPLRRGNGDEYPLRFPDPLPAGVELRVLDERGGWLHVQLAGGEIGWINRERVLPIWNAAAEGGVEAKTAVDDRSSSTAASPNQVSSRG